MNGVLERALEAGGIGVCVKDAQRKVLMQNGLCAGICGDRRGQTCEEGCMALHADDGPWQWERWGSRVYGGSRIHDRLCDVTLLCSDDHLITLLQPLDERLAKALDYYRAQGLTPREMEVISLTIEGVSNRDICRRLSISRATLRSHLNNIYGKLRDQGGRLDFIPPQRAPD